MDNLFEIKLSDITAPRLRDDSKINVGSCRKILSEYEPSDFESFILEWIKFCEYKDKKDLQIFKSGGTGDQGIDIYLKYGSIFEIVQCKRYSSALTMPETRRIITKILWYLFKGKDGYPNKIFISSVKGLNIAASKLITDKKKLKDDIIKHVTDDLSEMNIKHTSEEVNDFKQYLKGFSFDKIIATDIDVIISDYFRSDIGGMRFLNKRIELTRRDPDNTKVNNLRYVNTIEELLKNEDEKFKERMINDARVEYYSALKLETTCDYLFGNTIEFEKIKADIKTSVNNELLKSHSNNKEKYLAVREKAIETDVSNSYLSFELHMVELDDKIGTCHILTNDGELYWDE